MTSSSSKLADPDIVWTKKARQNVDAAGFDFGGEASPDRSGLRALVDSAFVSRRSMPALESLFERAAQRLATALRQLTDESADVTLETTASIRFSDFAEDEERPAVIGVVRAVGLDGWCLVAADAALVYAVVDLLLGAARAGGGDGERPLTTIELALARTFVDRIVRELDAAFEPVVAANLSLVSVETSARFANVARGAAVCALAKYRVKVGAAPGRLTFILPYEALESAPDSLREAIVGAGARVSSGWRDHLLNQSRSMSLDVSAVIGERDVTLREFKSLQVGDTLLIGRAGRAVVELRTRDRRLGSAAPGRAGDRLAVRLIETIGSNKDDEEPR